MIDDTVGAQVRSGAFIVDTRRIPDLPLCSGLTLAQQIQRIRADAFPDSKRAAVEVNVTPISPEEELPVLPEVRAPSIERQTNAPRVASIVQAEPSRAVSRPASRRKVSAAKKKSQGTAYYSSCRAARLAGTAPIFRGSAGYSSRLDRDGDGIACE